MDALAERGDELLQRLLARREQASVARARRQRVERPPEPVGARIRVAVDEAVLVQGLQRPRDLALVVADELGEP